MSNNGKATKTRRQCSACEFSGTHKVNTPEGVQMYCFRNPPTLMAISMRMRDARGAVDLSAKEIDTQIVAQFPLVGPLNWCGEFSRDPEKDFVLPAKPKEGK